MGVVLKQTSANIITISLALIIGGFNTLYFYPEFFGEELFLNLSAYLSMDNVIY